MDKETLSNYGWIVICTLVLAVMIALATPFGEYISAGVWSTTNGLNDTLNKNMEIAGLSGGSDDAVDNSYTFYPTPEGIAFLDRNFNLKSLHKYTLDVAYDDGSVKTTTAFAIPVVKDVMGLYIEEIDDGDNFFALYDNCIVGDDDIVYAEGNSIYGLVNYDESSAQITSITIDFGNAIDYSNHESGALFEDRFLTWNELKDEYDVTDATVGERAFRDCDNLISINIPDTVTTIGFRAFDGCSSLINATIPNTATNLGEGVFRGCSSLQKVILPKGITSINESFFGGCESLANITIPDSVTSIGHSAFSGCSSLETIVLPENVTIIDTFAFNNCKSLKNITIPNNVTTIGGYTFQECTSLTEIIIPNKVTSIGYNAFSDCQSLRSIILSNSITQIDSGAFQNCDSLSSIILPNNLTSISNGILSDCDILTEVTIPASVISIGHYVFDSSKSLKSITYEGTIEQWNTISIESSWNFNTSIEQINCSDGTITL